MVTQQLLDIIKQQTQQGQSKEVIKGNLLSQGWSQQDIDQAFLVTESPASSSTGGSAPAPLTPATPTIIQTSSDSRATISLILGIASLVAWLIPIVGLVISIIGIVFGKKGLRSAKPGIAKAGLILNIVGLVAAVAYWIYSAIVIYREEYGSLFISLL